MTPFRGPASDSLISMQGVEFAWRTHAIHEQWLARADTKAAVVITIEGAVVAAVATALSNATVAASITGWRLPVVLVGTLSSTVAVITAFLAIIPRLGRKKTFDREPCFLYFGHLRRKEAPELALGLAALSADVEIAQLAAQLPRLASAAWRKYVLLQVSVATALIGLMLLVVAFLWPRW
jgi:Family of unknown function (DUF5706)